MLTDMTPEERQTELHAHPAKSKYYTKAGRLTWFALGCGYRETKCDGTIRMYYSGGADGRITVEADVKDGTFREQFDSIAEARMLFDKLGE